MHVEWTDLKGFHSIHNAVALGTPCLSAPGITQGNCIMLLNIPQMFGSLIQIQNRVQWEPEPSVRVSIILLYFPQITCMWWMWGRFSDSNKNGLATPGKTGVCHDPKAQRIRNLAQPCPFQFGKGCTQSDLHRAQPELTMMREVSTWSCLPQPPLPLGRKHLLLLNPAQKGTWLSIIKLGHATLTWSWLGRLSLPSWVGRNKADWG